MGATTCTGRDYLLPCINERGSASLVSSALAVVACAEAHTRNADVSTGARRSGQKDEGTCHLTGGARTRGWRRRVVKRERTAVVGRVVREASA